MKDEHRTFKSCIFCPTILIGGKNGTRSREHIFGKSIAAWLGIKDHWSAPENYSISTQHPFKTQSRAKGSSPITFLTSRSVCRKCNRGVLREQLELANPTMLELFQGSKGKYHPAKQSSLFQYFCRFGMLVDAETSNLDLDKKGSALSEYANKFGHLRMFGPTIPFAEREKLIRGEIPNFVNIYLGRHRGMLGESMEFSVLDAGQVLGKREKRISFVVKNLAILIVLGRHNIEVPPSYLKIPQQVEINWPPTNTVSYDDYYSTHVQTKDIIWMRECLRDRNFRRQLKKAYKNTGKFSYPQPPLKFR